MQLLVLLLLDIYAITHLSKLYRLPLYLLLSRLLFILQRMLLELVQLDLQLLLVALCLLLENSDLGLEFNRLLLFLGQNLGQLGLQICSVLFECLNQIGFRD
jgi:uncharacterized SAM-dependent methyltransferase